MILRSKMLLSIIEPCSANQVEPVGVDSVRDYLQLVCVRKNEPVKQNL